MKTTEKTIRKTNSRTALPEVCLIPIPVGDDLLPFALIVGSIQEWVSGIISDRDLARSLRKAAFELSNGGQ